MHKTKCSSTLTYCLDYDSLNAFKVTPFNLLVHLFAITINLCSLYLGREYYLLYKIPFNMKSTICSYLL